MDNDVDFIKQKAAEFIDAILENDPESRMAASFINQAIDKAIITQMLAVKAVTWKDE